jgi:hypothetical protein
LRLSVWFWIEEIRFLNESLFLGAGRLLGTGRISGGYQKVRALHQNRCIDSLDRKCSYVRGSQAHLDPRL